MAKKRRRLKFTREEKRAQSISKTEDKAEKVGGKLDKAKEKLPVKKVKVKERVFDDDKGKAKTKIRFEEQKIPINEAKWNVPKKKSLPRKAVGAAGTAGVNKLHAKVYEVEHENVGTQAAHRGELLSESAFRGGKKLTRSGYRFVRNRPYRKTAKLEQQSIKTQIKLDYQKAVRDNPSLQKNPVSRFFQKRNIKRQYAADLRKAKQTGKTTKKTVGAVKKVAAKVTGIVRKNPVVLAQAAILMLLIFAIMAMFSMCSVMFSGGTGAIGATSYAAPDTDIDDAELYYTEWETDLQIEVQNAETTHSGYDEYRYNVGDIGHDPYELMGFLTAMYEDFSYSEVQSVMQGIFDSQYQLVFAPEVEIRTRTETRTDYWTDPETGEEHSDTYEVEVEYEWHILNITMTSTPFYNVIYPRMSADQRQHFDVLMRSKGNRQYVDNPFDINWLPYVSSNYGYRIHPISGDKNYHKGVDIGLPTGTEIKAGFDGIISTAAYDSGYGNYIVVQKTSDDGSVIEAKYAHCHTLIAGVGQAVSKGDVIATVGNTGNSTGSHLHLEVVKDSRHLNPLYFAVTGDEGNSRIPPGAPGGVTIPDYPGEPMGDGTYATMLEEAQKYIGYPYVWGGSSPSTSFDCSGYICWIINQSGAGSVGRTTAQGLYNLCTPVSAENAQPGDLIFYHSTYSASNPVTHVGLYIGNGQMLHCGDPIGYASINTNYWQQHFYAFARLP